MTLSWLNEEFLLTVGKNTIVGRAPVPLAKHEDDSLILHVLARTEGDEIKIEREIKIVGKN